MGPLSRVWGGPGSVPVSIRLPAQHLCNPVPATSVFEPWGPAGAELHGLRGLQVSCLLHITLPGGEGQAWDTAGVWDGPLFGGWFYGYVLGKAEMKK